jgi:hypothetical protein
MEVLLKVVDVWPLGVEATDYDWVTRGEGDEAVIKGEDVMVG